MAHVRLYQSALNDVKYVHGHPIKFKSADAAEQSRIKDALIQTMRSTLSK